jgi:CMP-N,N'-diacetyllegionaminic acid synthase
MNSIAVIIARSGSKGIKRKNLVSLGGQPLVSHIIQSAITASQSVQLDVIVSTDCDEIRNVATSYGAWAPFLRPAHLAEDNVPSLPVVQHAVLQAESIKRVSYQQIVYLQPTAPLCRCEDIVRCMNELSRNPIAESVVAVTEAHTHPFRMKRMLNENLIVNYIDQGFEDMRPRQQLPKVYRRAGSVYASRRHVVMKNNTLVGDPCFGVVVPPETAIDIDTQMDLDLATLYYNRLHNGGHQS